MLCLYRINKNEQDTTLTLKGTHILRWELNPVAIYYNLNNDGIIEVYIKYNRLDQEDVLEKGAWHGNKAQKDKNSINMVKWTQFSNARLSLDYPLNHTVSFSRNFKSQNRVL